MADDADGTGPDPDAHRSPARVRAVYEEIAAHFSKTRVNPWPEVETFLDGCRERHTGTEGRVGLDIGCGNGRHSVVLTDVVERTVGVDVSRGLLAEARASLDGQAPGNGRNPDGDGEREGSRGDATAALVQGDAAALPLATGSVDVGLYVATLHHLPDREARVGSLSELARVLAPGGRALVSAWSTTHDRFDADPDATAGFDTTVDWTLPGGETVPRFYHIYAPAEFERDLRESGLAVESAVVSSGNCYAEVRSGEESRAGPQPEGKHP